MPLLLRLMWASWKSSSWARCMVASERPGLVFAGSLFQYPGFLIAALVGAGAASFLRDPAPWLHGLLSGVQDRPVHDCVAQPACCDQDENRQFSTSFMTFSDASPLVYGSSCFSLLTWVRVCRSRSTMVQPGREAVRGTQLL